MTNLIIDTSAYSGFLRGDARAAAALRGAPEIHVPLIVLGELLAGFQAGTRAMANREQMARFIASPRVHVLRPDEKTAHQYADVYCSLRQLGTPIPTNDMWIAALARQYRLPLLTFDRHFSTVPGLQLA